MSLANVAHGAITAAHKTAKFPLITWFQSTNYIKAFIIASTISAVVIPISSEFHAFFLRRIEFKYRILSVMIVTFLANFMALVLMRYAFGTGGSLLAPRDETENFWFPPKNGLAPCNT